LASAEKKPPRLAALKKASEVTQTQSSRNNSFLFFQEATTIDFFPRLEQKKSFGKCTDVAFTQNPFPFGLRFICLSLIILL